MSIDRSLKIRGALKRHRNVIKRGERIERLKEEGLWTEGDSLLGLPKVANRKVSTAKVKEKAVEAEVEGAAVVEEGTAEGEDQAK